MIGIQTRIKNYRIAYPLSQKELAEKSGVSFEYDRNFLDSGIEISPLQMPLSG